MSRPELDPFEAAHITLMSIVYRDRYKIKWTIEVDEDSAQDLLTLLGRLGEYEEKEAQGWPTT